MDADLEYTVRQEAQNREYLAAWDNLTVNQKAALRARGIKGPIIKEGRRSSKDDPAPILDADAGEEKPGKESDAVEWLDRSQSISSVWDVAGEVDKTSDELQERFALSPKQAAAVSDYIHERLQTAVMQTHSLLLYRIVGFLISGTKNLLVSIHGLAHASRIAEINGFKSMRASAKACKSSHEWVRRAAWQWVEMLDLPPLQGAKSAEARQAYSDDKKTNHWRDQVCSPDKLKQAQQ